MAEQAAPVVGVGHGARASRVRSARAGRAGAGGSRPRARSRAGPSCSGRAPLGEGHLGTPRPGRPRGPVEHLDQERITGRVQVLPGNGLQGLGPIGAVCGGAVAGGEVEEHAHERVRRCAQGPTVGGPAHEPPPGTYREPITRSASARAAEPGTARHRANIVVHGDDRGGPGARGQRGGLRSGPPRSPAGLRAGGRAGRSSPRASSSASRPVPSGTRVVHHQDRDRRGSPRRAETTGSRFSASL